MVCIEFFAVRPAFGVAWSSLVRVMLGGWEEAGGQ
jgi:hypothetical protein